MSRPTSLICTVSLLAISLAFTACESIYARTYSPRRDYYEKPVQLVGRTEVDLLPPTSTDLPPSGGIAMPPGAPLDPGMPEAPVAPPPVEGAIPGL